MIEKFVCHSLLCTHLLALSYSPVQFCVMSYIIYSSLLFNSNSFNCFFVVILLAFNYEFLYINIFGLHWFSTLFKGEHTICIIKEFFHQFSFHSVIHGLTNPIAFCIRLYSLNFNSMQLFPEWHTERLGGEWLAHGLAGICCTIFENDFHSENSKLLVLHW